MHGLHCAYCTVAKQLCSLLCAIMNAVGVISFARIFTELKDLGYYTNKLIKRKQIVKVV